MPGLVSRPTPTVPRAETIPAYAFPENAARALGKTASHAAWRTQTPGLFWSFNDIHAGDARAMCLEIVEQRGETWLTDEELRRLTSAFGLPVVPAGLARDADEVLHEMRGFALLDGYRGRPRADIASLADVVLRVSRLAEDIPELIELDLNPVIALPAGQGCRIVDARLKVGRRG